MNLTTGESAAELLALDHIRSQLIRLEDTIIFCKCAMEQAQVDLVVKTALIERAKFALNAKIYQAGAFESHTGFTGSWLEWFLFETESFHGG